MKWYKFFTITAVASLAVFGGYAIRMGAFRQPWIRPVMMVLQGLAILSSQWMVAEEECNEEMFKEC